MEELTKENYYNSSYISNSSLNWILPETGGSVKKYEYFSTHPQEELDSDAIRLGKLIHFYVEKKTFDVFRISSVPSPSIKAVCDLLIDMDKGIATDTVLQAANKLEYQRAWKPETRVQKILDEGLGYMTSIKEAKAEGKMLVSEEELFKIKEIGEQIKEAVPEIFSLPSDPSADKYILNEHAICFDYISDIRCKSLIDILVVDKLNKNLTIYDLKTSTVPNSIYLGYNDAVWEDGNIVSKEVPGLYLKRNVHRQFAFYELACRMTSFREYNIENKIIAVETNAPYEVSVKEIPRIEIDLGFERITYAMALLINNNLVGFGL